MKQLNQITVLGIFLFISSLAFSQSPKKYCEAAEKFEKAESLTEALDSYSKAIAMDSSYARAYGLRALCNEKSGKKTEAIADYIKGARFNPNDKTLFYNCGRLFVELNRLEEADQMFRKALQIDGTYVEAIAAEIKVLHQLKNFDYGLNVTQYGINSKMSAINYYNHAVMHDSLNHLNEAEKYYNSAKEQDSKFMPAYIALALVNLKQSKADEAMKNCEIVLTKFPNNMDALYARSLVNAAKKNLQNAVNDITRVILSDTTNARALKQRASFYEQMMQPTSAITDYAQAIKLNGNDLDALMKRGACYEKIKDIKSAVADYTQVNTIGKQDKKTEGIAAAASSRMFELNREANKPEIEFSSIKTDQNILKVGADKNEFIFKGVIKDASLIKSITVSSGTAEFNKDSINPNFNIKLTDVLKLNELTLTVTDVYGNSTSNQYKIERTESDKPIIAIETPYTSFENMMSLDVNGPSLYVQGKIKDASLIESIMVEGINASFNPKNLNPDFSVQVDIAEKSKITMSVKDIYGNENTQVYTIDRSGTTAGIDNPMGNTWVVFIENGKYINFPSLEGPAKDVVAMKSALVNYKITKTIHKKDMTKQDMEKFFSIELRDYVKNNNINSLMIWYAGHGKYVSPTGYWVPSDGKVDDEFSYFGINNLKAAMQSYAGKLVHTLVITDACESGATFLMAMRGGDDEKKCDNWELTKAKSSQVFTSAGYELASDNSQFTKTFVSCLNNNVDMCLPIEKIVKKVTTAVAGAGNQAPKFGKIKDLEDEGGTYFFIKK